jgi:hypothetical protein
VKVTLVTLAVIAAISQRLQVDKSNVGVALKLIGAGAGPAKLFDALSCPVEPFWIRLEFPIALEPVHSEKVLAAPLPVTPLIEVKGFSTIPAMQIRYVPSVMR